MAVDLQQRQRREVTDETVDVGMQRSPVEQREIETEARLLAPQREHVREQGQQQRRRGDAPSSGRLLRAPPGGRVELAGVAHEPRVGDRGGVHRPGQLGRRWQRLEASGPVVAGTRKRPVLEAPPLGQDVVAERDRQRGELGVGLLVQRDQLLVQQLGAARVEDQQVEAKVQAGAPLVEDGGGHLKQRPTVCGEHLMRHAGAHGREVGVHDPARGAPQVVDGDTVGLHGGQDPLPAVGEDHRVVDHAAQLGLQHAPDVAVRVAGRARRDRRSSLPLR